jgi:sigma-B regulation protein RsbU (phosphoserine phosphatase)
LRQKNIDINELLDENERLKKSVDELSMLNEFARIISSTMSLDKILEKVVTAAIKAINVEQGTIHLLERPESEDPFKTLVRKADETDPEDKYRLDVELSGWMIKHRKPLLINDFSKEKAFKHRAAEEPKIRSVLVVPLLCKGNLIGVINLFNKKDPGGFTIDDQRLLSIIASQSAQIIENARLYEEEKQLRQFEQDLEMARSIQNRLLPKASPAIDGFDIAGVSYTAREVGGDYFDFIDLGAGRWGIALGDVSGKGIAAALLMSNLQATLRNQVLSSASLVECMAKTNQFLYLNTESTQFATLFCGVLNSHSKVFDYVNAGHNYPFYLNAQGEFAALAVGGLVLGMVPQFAYERGTVQFQPGEVMVIYSDGVTEAGDKLENFFGEPRLQELIYSHRKLPAAEIISKICAAVKEFTGPSRQDDDITLVVVKAV